ncbi:MAG: Hsp20/alpha crystallin family protein [Parcubacteria group bacterium]|nr:Hsp20/alpha crystallin family protein [Parcubacteria group bacterium]
MSIVRWRPMLDPFSDFDKFFEEWGGGAQGFVPALDVYQDKDHVIVETPLPGIDPDQVNISVENDVLTIEGATKKESEVDDKDYYRKEVRHGAFHRAVALPASVNGEGAKADYTNGVLKITIPKEERAKPKQIKIAAK